MYVSRQRHPEWLRLLWVCGLVAVMFLSGCRSSNVKKAEDHMAAGMYKQAIALIEEEINDKPTNAKAHYLLGKCYLATGDFREAEKSFDRAVRLNSDLRKDVGQAILEHGKERRLLELAVHYDPSIKQEVARKCLAEARKSTPSDPRGTQGAVEMVELAVGFDPGARQSAAGVLLELAKRSPDDHELSSVLERAVSYNPGVRRQAAMLLLGRAKESQRIPLLTEDQVVGPAHRGRRTDPSGLLDQAVKLDPSVKRDVAQSFIEQARREVDHYRVSQLLQGAIGYDENERGAAARVLISKAQERLRRGDLRNGLAGLQQAEAMDAGVRSASRLALSEAIATLHEQVTRDELNAMIGQCMQLLPDSGGDVFLGLLAGAENLLRQGKPLAGIDRVRAALIQGGVVEAKTRGWGSSSRLQPPQQRQLRDAVEANKERLRRFLLDACNKLIEGATEQFVQSMAILAQACPKVKQSDDLMTKYLYGAYLWLSDSRKEALEILRGVATRATLPCIEFASKPVASGKLAASQSIKDNTPFYGGEVVITISSVEVPASQDAIHIIIAVGNRTSSRQEFLFPRTQEEKRKRLETLKSLGEERRNKSRIGQATKAVMTTDKDFYIIDDLGNCIFAKNSTPYFRNSPNWRANDADGLYHRNKIALEPGQEVVERLVFSLPAHGCTSVRFGLPPQPETALWHKGFRFEPVVLQKVTFRRFPTGSASSPPVRNLRAPGGR